MKYYRVKAEIEFYIASEDIPSESDCERYAHECVNDTGFDNVTLPKEVTHLMEAPPEWKDAIPYGSKDDKPLYAILVPNDAWKVRRLQEEEV